jgi:NAD(P)-dependent dehydrogenase (short-subunit alcohol dehydrogenase family)
MPGTALVTGGSSGIGLAIARMLKDEGFELTLVSRRPERIEAAAAELGATSIAADVSEAEECERIVAEHRERFGGLDVLVCNAGRIVWKPVVETTEEEWNRVQAVNVKGTFLFCRAAIPVMRERGGGAIVCTASISGVVGLPLQSAYSASKGAIVQLTRQLAVELAPEIRVNAVAPGAIDTPFLHRLVEGSDDPAGLTAAIAADHPLQRIASADEVARTIVFLASEAAAFVTGAILPVDGGFTAK